MVIIWHNGKRYSDGKIYFVETTSDRDAQAFGEIALILKRFEESSRILGYADGVHWVDQRAKISFGDWLDDMLSCLWESDALVDALRSTSDYSRALLRQHGERAGVGQVLDVAFNAIMVTKKKEVR